MKVHVVERKPPPPRYLLPFPRLIYREEVNDQNHSVSQTTQPEEGGKGQCSSSSTSHNTLNF